MSAPQMGELAVEALTALDRADLDLLDDPHEHCCCWTCQPGPYVFGDRFVALCGRRAVVGDPLMSIVPPENACPDCLALLAEPCQICGAG